MKHRIFISFLHFFILSLFFSSAGAKVVLPSVLADNMVLQQQTEVNIWGKAAPGKTVTVSSTWSKQKYKTQAASDSTWLVRMQTPEAGGPYELTVSDGDKLTLRNVLIGEVWFCSGQSNMEMLMRGFDRQPLTDGSNNVIARAKASTPVRMFLCDNDADGHWQRQWARTPQTDVKGRWCLNEPQNVALCSAAAYYFAQFVQEVLEVPVAVIVSTLGGSRIECWMQQSGPVTEPDVKQHATPGVLYNAKVAPFQNYAVRGFLWYQGESNRDNAKDYAHLMKTMVSQWREAWKSKEAPLGAVGGAALPFYFVEIAPYDYEGADKTSSAYLREAQQRAAREIPNAAMISLLDAGNYNFIHPVNKRVVGERLALQALGRTYGRTGFGYEQPMYKDMELKDGKIYINVTGAVQGLCPMWTSLKGFEIAGSDRVFHPAFAEIETKSCRLAVSSKDVPEPVAVRYCFKNYAEASVFNIYGLPLAPFRTDNW
ncbi:MAG: sialate O-acetylesterase [Prevotella sp.]|nr:sialate O-acetylesterase [Prevotella sp.]